MQNKMAADMTLQSLVETFNSDALLSQNLSEILDNLLLCTTDMTNLGYVGSHIKEDVLLSVINNTKHSKKSCQLLAKILYSKPAEVVITSFGTQLLQSKSSNIEELQILWLQQILRLAEKEDSFPMFMSNPDLIFLVISSVERSLSVANLSRKILNLLFKHSDNTSWLFCDDILSICSGFLNQEGDGVVQFRVYEIFVDLITKHPGQISLCKEFKIFESLFAIITNGNDILAQLNALDLVSKIAVAGEEGLEYVKEKSLMTWIESTMLSDDPLMHFLVPGSIKFYGTVASCNPLEILPKYKTLKNTLFEKLYEEDPSLKSLCTETICHIASVPDGLKHMYNDSPEQMKAVLKHISKMVQNPGEENHVRIKAAESLASIFLHDGKDVEISMILEKLFRQIDANPIDFLLNLSKLPFNELKYSALQLLIGVSKYSWVEQDMVLCAGFLEYLLDRKTETEKVGHELKYEIIKHLSLSATSKENLGLDYYEKIIKYSKEGPFVSEASVAVTYQRES